MVFQMKKPQVFISFRGKDERKKLLPHLKHHLEASPSNTEKIKFVMPIFYKVEAYEVKEQKGEFGAKFRTLEKSCPDKVKKWKKALGFVANYVGLTYQEQSSVSELDFIKTVVKKVDQIFAKSPPNEIFDKSQLHLSKTLEALNLEGSYFRGFMHGSAWKDLISFVQSSNRFEIPVPESSIQFPMNRQRFDLQAERNELFEKATNILALRMMHNPTEPALIFSNWDKLDDEMKNYIFDSAHKKIKMIKIYNVDIDSEPLFRSNVSPYVEELIWDKTLEPQVWPHPDHRRASSFHDNREQSYPLLYEMDWPVEPLVEPPAKPRVQLPDKSPVKPLFEAQRSNDNTGQRKVVPERRDDNPGYFTTLCYCLKSCVCLT
ncbi:hypothetical protein F2Q70_00032965 [Brassica cretica]|uniref:TIR domain-containing protein n=1 Tax=Brassica cretica TaxID=69181 RepID=A0A8S9FDK7_BRACR|nr:hypothetical protein F2Q70_00032965 [Brassica cretica]KAF2552319.1 hypothetical protein F2Q68_00037325 [Brassica cretica]